MSTESVKLRGLRYNNGEDEYAYAVKTFAACAIVAGFSAAAIADQPQDVVEGPGKQPVRSERFGTCVQTKWNAKDDICAPAPVAKKVEIITPAPAPEPVTQLEREQLTIYFQFNKSVVTPYGKVKLDRIADAANRSPKVTKIDIVGYTDQIGSDSYNNSLSIRRANAIKSYLDTKTHIDTGVLGLRGLGKQDPVVDCTNVKKREQKIVCGKKDRRVEIEFEFQK